MRLNVENFSYKGSYGDVYKAINIDTNEQVALKFIPLQRADDQEVSTIVNEINIIRETFGEFLFSHEKTDI